MTKRLKGLIGCWLVIALIFTMVSGAYAADMDGYFYKNVGSPLDVDDYVDPADYESTKVYYGEDTPAIGEQMVDMVEEYGDPSKAVIGWNVWGINESGYLEGAPLTKGYDDYLTDEDLHSVGVESGYSPLLEPLYTDKYKIDPQPDSDTYTVGTKMYDPATGEYAETEDVSCQWYEAETETYKIVGANATEGVWEGDVIDTYFNVQKGDIINVEILSEEFDGTIGQYDEFYFDETDGVYKAEMRHDIESYNLYIYGSEYITARISLTRRTMGDAVDGQEGKTLTEGEYGVEYACSVTFNPGGDGVVLVSDSVIWNEQAVPLYSVNFVGGEGATGDAPVMEDKAEGDEFELPHNPFEKYSHLFYGWSDGESVYIPGDVYTMGAGAVTFTAQWEELFYVVEMDDTYDFGTLTVGYDAPTPKILAIENTGNTFTGDLEVTITGEDAEAFTCPDIIPGLNMGEISSDEYYISLAQSLPAGTYEATITVKNEYDTLFETATVKAKIKNPSSGGGGGGATYYTVSFSTDGGSKVETQRVRKNSTVSQPDDPTKEGYKFEGWYEDEKSETPYDFSKAVTGGFVIYAKWSELENTVGSEGTDGEPTGNDDASSGSGNGQHSCPTSYYDDLDTSKWYHLNTDYVLSKGLFKGYSDTIFKPDNNLTRAMMITVIYRSAGEPEVYGSATFADVVPGSYYEKAVIWGQKEGIVEGHSETVFAPEENITREQIATILYRYAKYMGYNVSAAHTTSLSAFTDADEVADYAVLAMQYAVGTELIIGRTLTTLCPKEFATRVEMAAMLHRFLEGNK